MEVAGGDVHEERINRDAVGVIVAGVDPGLEVGLGEILPLAHLAGGGDVEIIVITDKAIFAGWVNRQVIAVLRPEDVVFDLDVSRNQRAVGGDADRVAAQLINGVIVKRGIVSAIQGDAGSAAVI